MKIIYTKNTIIVIINNLNTFNKNCPNLIGTPVIVTLKFFIILTSGLPSSSKSLSNIGIITSSANDVAISLAFKAIIVPITLDIKLFSDTKSNKSEYIILCFIKKNYIFNYNNMNNNDLLLKNLIKKAFKNYDTINNKTLGNKNDIDIIETNINKDNTKIEIIYKDETIEYDAELLGIFDESTNIWIWSWNISHDNKKIGEITKELINYGLDITYTEKESDKIYIKSVLTTSRLYINNQLNLSILLAITTYLIKNKIKGFYQKSYPKNRQDNLVLYYIMK